MVSPPPLLPRRPRRRRLSPFLGPSVTGPGPGSEGPAAAPAPRRRWRHPHSPVGSAQPPPPPPARGNTGHGPAEWGWGPAAPGSGYRLQLWLRRGPTRRSSAPRGAPSCLLSVALLLTLSPAPSSLHDKRTTPARSASLPQPRSRRRDVTSVTSSEGRDRRQKGWGAPWHGLSQGVLGDVVPLSPALSQPSVPSPNLPTHFIAQLPVSLPSS
jgi:hypothetical protein